MNLTVLAETVAVCRLAPSEPVPDWAWKAPGFVSVTRTSEEWSVVCTEEMVPEGTVCEPGWSILKVAGPLDFSLTGILASLAGPLADAGISVFALATYDTDYLLVKSARLEDAVTVLQAAGHRIAR